MAASVFCFRGRSGCSAVVLLSNCQARNRLLNLALPFSCSGPLKSRTSMQRTDTTAKESSKLIVDQKTPEQPFTGIIPIDELRIQYSRSGGPGGQHVNKVNTKVEIRCHVTSSSWIPEWIKARLLVQEKNRISKEGFLIITSDKTRKQILNQADCLARLRAMIFAAAKKPKELSPEEIDFAEKRKAIRSVNILTEKRHDSLKKANRGTQSSDAL